MSALNTEIHSANERVLLAELLRREDHRAQILDDVLEEHFGNSRHKALIRAVRSLHLRGAPIDEISVNEAIAANEDTSMCPPQWVSELRATKATLSNTESACARIRRQSAFRELALEARSVFENCAKQEGDPWEMAHRLSVRSADISAGKIRGESLTLDDAHREVLKRADAAQRGESFGLPTGLVGLDEKTGGLKPGELTIIAAASSVGKSALAFSIAMNVVGAGEPVLFASLEMSSLQIGQRHLAMQTGISAQKLIGRLSKDDYATLYRLAQGGKRIPFRFTDRGRMTINDVRSEAQLCARKHGLALLVVDYMQLVEASSGRYGSRERDVAEVSRGLKALSLEMSIPVLGLSQVNRESEKRSGEARKPVLSDLRESAAIGHDADNVWMIWRDDYGNPTSASAGEAEIWIRKQRNGPTGMVRVQYQHERMRFRDERVF